MGCGVEESVELQEQGWRLLGQRLMKALEEESDGDYDLWQGQLCFLGQYFSTPAA